MLEMTELIKHGPYKLEICHTRSLLTQTNDASRLKLSNAFLIAACSSSFYRYLIMERWSLIIDIEGFSKIYPDDMVRALKPLRSLMEAIYNVGKYICPESPKRLFAHQIGDGFIIVSEFSECSPELPLALGIFLLRNILIGGGLGKCAISQGHFSDIQGCYPKSIIKNIDNSGTVRIGRGIMRVFPVMGSALINAYRLSNMESGSLLIVDGDFLKSIPEGSVISKSTDDYKIIDWIHSNTTEIKEITNKTKVTHPDEISLEESVRKYIKENDESLPEVWTKNTVELNKIPGNI
jgi:hypothetical protein